MNITLYGKGLTIGALFLGAILSSCMPPTLTHELSSGLSGTRSTSITEVEISSTPTNTLSPTATLTPAITLTSTIEPTGTLPPSLQACIPQNTKRETALVTRVIDGDTIEVQMDNQIYRVRYIGIDTPEREENFFTEATEANKRLVEGKTVLLVKDVSEVDRYNRLLRYVIVGDIFVNYELVRQGFAFASTYPPDVACSEALLSAQQIARSSETGLWKPSPSIVRLPDRTGNCDPSYPDVCIAPPPPDLDCRGIPYRRFRVLPPDPHRFDGDHDGIGCESN